MQNKKQYFPFHHKTPQCCFIQFFSQNHSIHYNTHKNTNGLINPYKTNTQFLDPKEIAFHHQKTKTQIIPEKRSISSMKIRKRQSNRVSYQTHNNQQTSNQQLNIQKVKSPLRSSQVVQRYFSPKPQNTTKLSTSQLQDKKKIQAYFNPQTIQNKIQYQTGKSHPFFKQQKAFQPIQFTKSCRVSNHETPTQIPKSNIKFNFIKYNQQQTTVINLPKPIQSINPIQPQTKVPLQTPQIILNPPIVQKSQKNINNEQTKTKKDNPEQISNIQKDLKKRQTLRQSIKLIRSSLDNIEQLSKQQSRQDGILDIPINPFQHIQSFVQIRKQKHFCDDQQKQYDSIKTKGRPVQSMMQMTKDMTKTKKPKKHGKNQSQTGLHDLQNMTVTSQFDQHSERDKAQRIEQSTVLMDFFNPPTHLKDKLELSRANKIPLYEKSGFRH